MQHHRRRHIVSESVSISYNAFDGPIRNKMAAQCFLSSTSRPLTATKRNPCRREWREAGEQHGPSILSTRKLSTESFWWEVLDWIQEIFPMSDAASTHNGRKRGTFVYRIAALQPLFRDV